MAIFGKCYDEHMQGTAVYNGEVGEPAIERVFDKDP